MKSKSECQSKGNGESIMGHYACITKNEVDIYVLNRKNIHAYIVNWEEK